MTSVPTFPAVSFPCSLKALPFVAALAFGVSVSLPARASEPFPAHLAEKYEMPCVPACTLCHLTSDGGARNFREGFVVSLLDVQRETGLTIEGGVATSLDPLLAVIESRAIDQDKDGIPDIDELGAGTDPGGAGMLCDVPKYGCGASSASSSVAPSNPTRFGALALAASVMLAFGLRRRR